MHQQYPRLQLRHELSRARVFLLLLGAAVLLAVALSGCDTGGVSAGATHTPSSIISSPTSPSPSPGAPTAARIVTHSGAAMVDPSSKSPATASCDSNHGEQMIGGGYQVAPTSSQLHVMASYPADSETWKVFAHNTSPTPGTVTAYVYCFIGPPTLTISIVASAPTTIAGGPSPRGATAVCGGNVPTSGGFYFSPPHAAAPSNLDPDGWMIDSQFSVSAWSIDGYAIGDGGSLSPGVDLVALAVCVGAEHIAPGDAPMGVVSVASGHEVAGSVPASACPAGETMVNGGFKPEPGTGSNFTEDGGATLDRWPVAMLNANPAAMHIIVFGECVTFR